MEQQELLERTEPLAQLEAALARARDGRGTTALVLGEAGIGKTSLARRFVEGLPAGVRCAWGSCDALLTPRPFGPFHDLAREWMPAVRDALLHDADRSRLFAAVLDALLEGAETNVLVLEDLHWADEATLDLLRFLGRRIREARALLILTFRDDELGPDHALRGVLGEWPRAGLVRVPLNRLSSSAVRDLVGAAPTDFAELHRITGGNPFFVVEALSNPEEAIPASVTDAVLARLGRMESQARAVVELASITPTRIDNELLEAVCAPTAAAIDECVTRGVLVPDGRSLAFRHELARLAVLDALPPGTRRELNATVLGWLLRRSASADLARVVHHAIEAADVIAVLKYAPEAARAAAAVGSHREACAYWRTALEFMPDRTTIESAEALEAHAYEAYLTGCSEEALTSQTAAHEVRRKSVDPVGVGRNLRWMSRLSWFLGRAEDAQRYAEEAVGVLESANPQSDELAMALSNRAQLAMLDNDVKPAVCWATSAVELAERLGAHETLVHALNNLGTARLSGGDESGRAELERSLELALAGKLEEHAARAYTNLASTAVDAGHPAAVEYLRVGIGYCEERDLDSWSGYMRGWRARLLFEEGRWSEASEDAELVLARATRSPVIRLPALLVRARLRVRRGDPGAGEALEEALGLAAASNEIQRIGPAASALAEQVWLRGGASDEIVGGVRSGFELAVRRGAAPTVGELGLWMRRAAALEEPPEACPEPWAAWIRGNWQEAADAWAQLGRPYERADALSEGDEDAQREALAVFLELGARPAAERVRAALRARGVSGLPRGPRPKTRANPAGLTARQMDVLKLLSQRLTYEEVARRLFVSKKTVENHVSALLARLGAATSPEAVQIAKDRGLLP